MKRRTMKQSLKNEIDMLNLINKLAEQLSALEKKVDILVHRSTPETKPASKAPEHHKSREMYKAICADCNKECSIPFKPSGDRPVYCQDCFSRRKMISMSGMKIEEKPKEIVPVKKAAAAKKTVTKKKATPKRK